MKRNGFGTVGVRLRPKIEPPPEGRVIRTRFGPEADKIRSEKKKKT